jgi:signal transduction histidine kinase
VTVLAWIIAVIAILFAVAVLLSWRRSRRRVVATGGADREGRASTRRSEELANAAFARLPIAAVRVDDQGRVLAASDEARRRFPGLETDMSLLTAFGSHDLAGEVAAALAGGEPRQAELRLFSEGQRTFHAAVEPYEVDGLREAAVALSDLSEAMAFQELRSQFVANVSHELRTPLTGLRGLLEALEDPELDARTRATFAARAGAETQRLEAIIEDVLFLSELEASEGLPTNETSDLGVAVAAAADEVAVLGDDREVAIELDLADAVWTGLTERMAVTVARNLLENAVRYAGPGATARASVRRSGDLAMLEVADDGVGIPERHLPHVFERFYRADPSRSRSVGGNGLGLSIVKHIAERMGGEATATSREGYGTTVTVRLPAADLSAQDGADVADAPQPAPGR